MIEFLFKEADISKQQISLTDRNIEILDYQKTDNVLRDVEYIIDTSQKTAYRSVNIILLQRNWLIGKRITEESLAENNRAEYGAEVIKKLAESLTSDMEMATPAMLCTAMSVSIIPILRFFTQ